MRPADHAYPAVLAALYGAGRQPAFLVATWFAAYVRAAPARVTPEAR